METIYIKSEEDLNKYQAMIQGKEMDISSIVEGFKSKDVKIVLDGTMKISSKHVPTVKYFIWSLVNAGFNVDVDIKLNQKIDRSTVIRSDLISKEMAYLIYSIPSNVQVNCVYEKPDGQVLSINGRYFSADWEGVFILKSKSDFSGEYKDFIDEIRLDKYDEIIKCNSISDIENQIGKIKDYGHVKLAIDLDKNEYNENFLQVLALFIKEAESKGKIIDVVINAEDMKISVDVARTLLENKHFNSYDGVSILYSGEYDNTYTGEEMLTAMAKAKLFIDEVKNSKASPFEKYLMIYRYVSQRRYISNEETQGKTRDIISILNGDDIVCAGYANLLKWICNEVGIECETQDVNVGTEAHRNNRVYIKDDKYGLDGWFYADATWDSHGYENSQRYSFCLVPIDDVKHIKRNLSFSNSRDSLGVFYGNAKEFVNVQGFTSRSYYISDKYVEKLGIHETMSEKEAREAFDSAIDVIERIMNRNSIGKYIFNVDNSSIISSVHNIGGIHKYIVLYLSGVFSEEELEQIMIQTDQEYGKKLKEDYDNQRLLRQNSDLRNFDYITKMNIENREEDILDAENTIKKMKEEDPNNPEIAELEEGIKEVKVWIEEHKIEREKKREELIESFSIDVIDRDKEFKNIKDFLVNDCLDWQKVNQIFKHIRSQSKPIGLENFYNAVVESYIAQGFPREDAEKMAKEEIEKTQNEIQCSFGAKSTNCFMPNSAASGVLAGSTNSSGK